eukprot:m.35905 g.35905  ORF g.35905 m.35905 type:complete len:423 (+) comp9941_c0_seq1:171-1439(+)
MVQGSFPFVHTDLHGLFARILAGEYAHPRTLEAATIIKHMLVALPHLRSSAQQLLDKHFGPTSDVQHASAATTSVPCSQAHATESLLDPEETQALLASGFSMEEVAVGLGIRFSTVDATVRLLKYNSKDEGHDSEDNGLVPDVVATPSLNMGVPPSSTLSTHHIPQPQQHFHQQPALIATHNMTTDFRQLAPSTSTTCAYPTSSSSSISPSSVPVCAGRVFAAEPNSSALSACDRIHSSHQREGDDTSVEADTSERVVDRSRRQSEQELALLPAIAASTVSSLSSPAADLSQNEKQEVATLPVDETTQLLSAPASTPTSSRRTSVTLGLHSPVPRSSCTSPVSSATLSSPTPSNGDSELTLKRAKTILRSPFVLSTASNTSPLSLSAQAALSALTVTPTAPSPLTVRPLSQHRERRQQAQRQ